MKPIIKNIIKIISIFSIFIVLIICFWGCNNNNKSSVESIKVGDTFCYGTYEQDNDKSNGEEGIEWLILARENNKILLISKYALDCQVYCGEGTGTSWKDSDLRTWLNTSFIQNAFNDTEKNNIIATEIISEIDETEKVKDKVFVLNNDQAEKYFENNISRRCTPTDYAKQHGVKTPEMLQDVQFSENIKDTCCYWLRSPGFHDDKVSIVDYEGTVYERGQFIDDEIAVRPVLWLNVDSFSK